LADIVAAQLESHTTDDASVRGAIQRLAKSVTKAISWHG
jgi:hypothetical protein